MLWKIILPALALSCFLYYGVIRLASGRWNSTFSRMWPAAGILLLAFSYLEQRGYLPEIVHWMILAFVFLIFLTCLPIIGTMLVRENEDCEYLIILGAHVNGRVASDSLKRRIIKAEEYLKAHPQTKVIVSGGQGVGEEITEAECMQIYLWEHGIEKDRILEEAASTTTKENLAFSKGLFTPEIVKVGIVTNNFHLHRSCALARRLGYPHIYPISAGCRRSLFLNYMMREVPAMWKFWLDKGKDDAII